MLKYKSIILGNIFYWSAIKFIVCVLNRPLPNEGKLETHNFRMECRGNFMVKYELLPD